MAYLVEHQISNPRAWFDSHQSFGQWLKFLANLTYLINLLGCNLGKTQMLFSFRLLKIYLSNIIQI